MASLSLQELDRVKYFSSNWELFMNDVLKTLKVRLATMTNKIAADAVASSPLCAFHKFGMELCETMHWVLDHLLELCHPIC
jgi:hypothetical protein